MTDVMADSFRDFERASGGAAIRRTLEAGETLFRQGDATVAVYGVVTGAVRLTRTAIDGRQVVVFRAEAGATFAEAALFADAYHCDAVADRPAVVAVFPTAALRSRLAADPESALRLAARLARQVQALRGQMELRNIRSAEDRVLAALVLRQDAASGLTRLPMPLKLFAAEIGLTHEALYRTIARLERAGRIARGPEGIRIREAGLA
jgi:CRP-like cAMP-binding protein